MAAKKKILIVEDNLINREVLGSILSPVYEVLEAENGEEGLAFLKEQKAGLSLILLDIVMPVMDGYAFLSRVKADAELALIPVVVTTQGSSEADEVAALSYKRCRLRVKALPAGNHPAPGCEYHQPEGDRSHGQRAAIRPADRALQQGILLPLRQGPAGRCARKDVRYHLLQHRELLLAGSIFLR